MVEKIKKSEVEQVLTVFCRNIVDKYTLNLEKIKSIEIIATESDTDSERVQTEKIKYQANIEIDFNKLIQDLPSDEVVINLVELFNEKFNFTQKQKENNFVRMKTRMINILDKIKSMNTFLDIEESTSIAEIKKIMVKKLVNIFFDNGIMDQLKNTIDELRPYKHLGILLGILLLLYLLIKIYYFSVDLYFKFFTNNPKLKQVVDEFGKHTFY